MEIPDLFIGSVQVMLLTLGLTQAIKIWFSLEGKLANMLACLMGLMLAIVAQLVTDGIPENVNTWIIVIVLGLVYGLAASGFY